MVTMVKHMIMNVNLDLHLVEQNNLLAYHQKESVVSDVYFVFRYMLLAK